MTSATVLSSEADESQALQVRRALERAWFSPRFEEGRGVPTEGFVFTEYWHDIAPPEPEAAAGPDGEAAPAQAGEGKERDAAAAKPGS